MDSTENIPPTRRPPSLLAALAAGIAAGAIAWLGGEALRGRFVVPPGLEGSYERSAALKLARSAANVKNAALAFGLLGAASGLGLGLAGGRGPRRAIVAGTIGLLTGAAAGAGTTWGLAPLLERNLARVSTDMLFPILIHGGIGMAIGASGGLALGLGRAGPGRDALTAMIGGLLGAGLGVAAFDVLGTLVDPSAVTGQLLPATSTARLLGQLAVAAPAALGAVLALRDADRRPRSAPVPGAEATIS